MGVFRSHERQFANYATWFAVSAANQQKVGRRGVCCVCARPVNAWSNWDNMAVDRLRSVVCLFVDAAKFTQLQRRHKSTVMDHLLTPFRLIRHGAGPYG